MKIIGLEKIEEFAKLHADAKSQLQSWIAEVNESNWNIPNDINEKYNSASFLSNNVVVFNIKGNHYRLVTKINYKNAIVLIKNIGTHAEYSKWNLT
jgi:mRNA interferase HigB